MSSQGNKRNSITIPNPISIPQRSREPSIEAKGRSNSTARKNSITDLAQEFADNSEKLATRHSTNKIQVIVDAVIKVLETLKN